MSYSHPLPNVEEMAFLKVDNVANLTSSSTLKHVFENYGPVGDVYISENHLTEEPYRVAFIHFYNKHDAKNAMGALNGILLDGCKLRIKMVHNNVPQYAQLSCGQGEQYYFKEDNQEFQRHGERHCCSSNSLQSRSHSSSSPDHSESRPQSHSSHRRLPSSTKRSNSSMSNHQLPDKSCPRSRHHPRDKKKKSKSRSSHTHAFECPKGEGKLLGEENMQNNERQEESEQSKSMFNSPHRSEANATDTLMAVPSIRSRTRKRCRGQQNWRERPWMEREHMKNNQKQMEYLQSESTFKKPGVSKDHKCEVLMLYNSSQKRTRRRCPGHPKPNKWMKCEAMTLDVAPQDDSERGSLTSIQQSKNRTKSECGFWTTKYQGKTKNDDIIGGMGFIFNIENSNPQNDLVFLSGFGCHDSNRNEQKQVHHQQPESTCVIPFLPEEDTTEILMEDPLTREGRNTRSESPEVLIVGEMTEIRTPQPIHQVALVKGHHHVSTETFPHLNIHEPLPSGRPVFPLNISELQRRHSFTSSPRSHIVCTAHRGQPVSVTPANFVCVEINKKEHTNSFSHSNQAGMQNSEIISVAQTSNTSVEFPLATVPYGTSGYTLTEILDIEHNNCPEIGLEVCDSSSSQNNRRVYSGDSSISSFVSSSFSHSTRNSSTVSSLFSSSTPRQPILQIPIILETTITRDENLPDAFQINEDNNERILSFHPPSETRRETQVAGREESDNSDSWPLLPNFANFNDIHNNHPKGLTKEQINTLPIRAFCESDRLNICTICITEYTESSRIRILPCSHEYHDECIDNWLSEKSNCPICRRQIINPPDDTEIPF
ncbi:E3 ubiquitin-protein ligase RLIM-like [Onychomys torridus]|uniref:E3 ubiquitin-protein ligase RLIM-like n=1 Tax=Onychomys torridus TaxID=38674 RepID=UPI00167F2DDB|nr:E3 ubiquitin-protein ligase RLIM-like [Onychomys torridus]